VQSYTWLAIKFEARPVVSVQMSEARVRRLERSRRLVFKSSIQMSAVEVSHSHLAEVNGEGVDKIDCLVGAIPQW
jgi:hypothetical protein